MPSLQALLDELIVEVAQVTSPSSLTASPRLRRQFIQYLKDLEHSLAYLSAAQDPKAAKVKQEIEKGLARTKVLLRRHGVSLGLIGKFIEQSYASEPLITRTLRRFLPSRVRAGRNMAIGTTMALLPLAVLGLSPGALGIYAGHAFIASLVGMVGGHLLNYAGEAGQKAMAKVGYDFHQLKRAYETEVKGRGLSQAALRLK